LECFLVTFENFGGFGSFLDIIGFLFVYFCELLVFLCSILVRNVASVGGAGREASELHDLLVGCT
jgi:hypothetical protein